MATFFSPIYCEAIIPCIVNSVTIRSRIFLGWLTYRNMIFVCFKFKRCSACTSCFAHPWRACSNPGVPRLQVFGTSVKRFVPSVTSLRAVLSAGDGERSLLMRMLCKQTGTVTARLVTFEGDKQRVSARDNTNKYHSFDCKKVNKKCDKYEIHTCCAADTVP